MEFLVIGFISITAVLVYCGDTVNTHFGTKTLLILPCSAAGALRGGTQLQQKPFPCGNAFKGSGAG